MDNNLIADLVDTLKPYFNHELTQSELNIIAAVLEIAYVRGQRAGIEEAEIRFREVMKNVHSLS